MTSSTNNERRKSSGGISNDKCAEIVGTLDAVRDSKVSQILPVRGIPQLVRHIKDGKLAR
jgi:hypothetical protein